MRCEDTCLSTYLNLLNILKFLRNRHCPPTFYQICTLHVVHCFKYVLSEHFHKVILCHFTQHHLVLILFQVGEKPYPIPDPPKIYSLKYLQNLTDKVASTERMPPVSIIHLYAYCTQLLVNGIFSPQLLP